MQPTVLSNDFGVPPQVIVLQRKPINPTPQNTPSVNSHAGHNHENSGSGSGSLYIHNDLKNCVLVHPATRINNFGRIYPKYDITYPTELEAIISKAEFEQSIFEINEDLSKIFQPECYTLYIRPIVFFCCVPTLGLSCCLLGWKINQAQFVMSKALKKQNLKYYGKPISWGFRRNARSAWIEIKFGLREQGEQPTITMKIPESFSIPNNVV